MTTCICDIIKQEVLLYGHSQLLQTTEPVNLYRIIYIKLETYDVKDTIGKLKLSLQTCFGNFI